jgi:hypothetical protein
MNKKLLMIIAGGVLLLALGAVLALRPDTDDKSSGNNTNSSASSGSADLGAKDACDYLNDAVATQILGGGAIKGENNANTSSADVNVSTCTYSSKTDGTAAGIRNMTSATILLRAPLSNKGGDSNHEPFDNLKEGAQQVSGLGDEAYWDPELGQLNVLKKDAWFIISTGKMSAADRTLNETRKLADLIIPKY